MIEGSTRPFLEFRDPVEMSCIFSNEDAMSLKELIKPQFEASFQEVREKLAVLPLPKKEIDYICLYYIVGKSQEEIAAMFGVSQGDVSYRIKRILERLRFVFSLPRVDLVQMEEDLNLILQDKEMVKIMLYMAESSSQTVTGYKLGLSQGRVRYRFLKALSIMKARVNENSRLEQYCVYFDKVGANFNILRALASTDYKG